MVAEIFPAFASRFREDRVVEPIGTNKNPGTRAGVLMQEIRRDQRAAS
jgi:hypothetical protein